MVEGAGEEEYDVFKHSLARYFGYANELGESFRPLVHARWVAFSYGVAGMYVAADTADKYLKAQRLETYTAAQRQMLGASNAIDTAIWQGLASVAIPGLVINRIVWAASKLPMTGRMSKVVPTVRSGQPACDAMPTSCRSPDLALETTSHPMPLQAIGLASVPFIITPIDNAVHKFADLTYKPILKRFFPVPHKYPSD